MTRLDDYEVHPVADLFPLLAGEEFDALVLDIQRNGLNEPIVLDHTGKVLVDGRNRLLACNAGGVDYVYRKLGPHYTGGVLIDFIVSANLARRHLNVGQRAFLALPIKAAFADVTKLEQRKAGEARSRAEATKTDKMLNADLHEALSGTVDSLSEAQAQRRADTQAARAVKVSPRAVSQAVAVQRDTPDLADEVIAGRMALDAADRERKRRIASQPKPEATKPGPVLLKLKTHIGEEVDYPAPVGKVKFNLTAGEGISWASWSWNPVTGCLHGCTYCYARELATSQRFADAYPAGFTPLFHPERLSAPANTTLPEAYLSDPSYRRVFVCSMADLYGRWVPDGWIEQVHQAMLGNPQWTYLLLTKFPGRYVGLDLPSSAWAGTSVDEQNRVRIAEDAFRQIKGVQVKWLSLEPLREPLVFEDLSMFDWVVIGAQTETRQPEGVEAAFAPPFEWVARIVAQAREAGCRVHLKPNLLGRIGPQSPGMALPDEYPELITP